MGRTKAADIEAGTIVDGDLASGANVDAAKLRHQTHFQNDLGIAYDASVGSTKTVRLLNATQDLTLRNFKAACHNTGAATTTLSFDLQKNGSGTMLTGAISITDATTDNEYQDGTFSDGSVSAGDYVDCIFTVTNDNGATGPRIAYDVDHAYD